MSDQKKTLRWFKTAWLTGTNNASKVGWSTKFNQQIRFQILSQIDNLNNQNVLDFGCGLGDLFPYLSNIYPQIKYVGIDITKEYIKTAREKYPNTQFIHGDDQKVKQNYDYILCSGVFSCNEENSTNIYKNTISKLYKLSNKAIGINFLKKGKHIENHIYKTWDPNLTYKWAQTMSSNVKLIDSYLPHDFTLFIYKQ